MTETLTKSEQARQLLGELFASSKRIAIADAVAAGKDHGVSRRTMARVAHQDLGVTEIHNGPYPAFWEAASGHEVPA